MPVTFPKASPNYKSPEKRKSVVKIRTAEDIMAGLAPELKALMELTRNRTATIGDTGRQYNSNQWGFSDTGSNEYSHRIRPNFLDVAWTFGMEEPALNPWEVQFSRHDAEIHAYASDICVKEYLVKEFGEVRTVLHTTARFENKNVLFR